MRASLSIVLFSALSLLYSCGNSPTKEKVNTNQEVNLDSLVQAQPDNVDYLLKRANALIEDDKFDLAMNDAAKAYRLDSTNNETKLIYAEVMVNRETRTVADVASAQRLYSEIIRVEPKNVRALVGMASTYSFQQDYQKSFEYINKALRIDMRYRNAYVLKGSNYVKMGKLDLAKSSYQTAIQQDPEFFKAYFFLGLLYQAEQDEICIEYFKTALDLEPNNQEVRYQLAYSEQMYGDREEAKELYRVMAKDTNDTYVSHALFQQAWIHQFLESNLDSAVYFYNSALQTEPRYVEAWHNLGVCYDQQGDKTRALKSFGKALKYNPDFTLSREYADSIR